MEQSVRGMWEHFTITKAWARTVLVDVEKERQDGQKAVGNRRDRTKTSWSLSGTGVTCALKVYLCVVHTTQGGQVIGKTLWKTSSKMAGSAHGVKVRECYNEVEAEDEFRLSIKQDILRQSTDFLWGIIVPTGGVEGVTLSYVWPHGHCFPLVDCFWWVSSGHGKKQCNWRYAACAGQYDWRAPNRVLVIQDSTDHREATVFRAHATPHGTCDNVMNKLRLLTNQQKDGNSPVGKIVSGLLEGSRSIVMEGLWKFIAVGNHEAVQVGGLQRETRSKKVVRTEFSGAVIREGADEPTLRAQEEGVVAYFHFRALDVATNVRTSQYLCSTCILRVVPVVRRPLRGNLE